MRTTMTLEEDVARALKEVTREKGQPFKQVVNDLLRAGLEARLQPSQPRRYRLQPVSLGKLRAGVNLDQALRLAGEIEDTEIARELEMRK